MRSVLNSMDEKEKNNVVPPTSKKPKRSLSLKKNARPRFKEVNEDVLQEMSKPIVPHNTSLDTKWAMKNLADWYNDYNKRNPENPCPGEIILPNCSAEKFNKWFCVYLAETTCRSHSEDQYQPATLFSLLSAILQYMRKENPSYPKFSEQGLC